MILHQWLFNINNSKKYNNRKTQQCLFNRNNSNRSNSSNINRYYNSSNLESWFFCQWGLQRHELVTTCRGVSTATIHNLMCKTDGKGADLEDEFYHFICNTIWYQVLNCSKNGGQLPFGTHVKGCLMAQNCHTHLTWKGIKVESMWNFVRWIGVSKLLMLAKLALKGAAV